MKKFKTSVFYEWGASCAEVDFFPWGEGYRRTLGAFRRDVPTACVVVQVRTPMEKVCGGRAKSEVKTAVFPSIQSAEEFIEKEAEK